MSPPALFNQNILIHYPILLCERFIILCAWDQGVERVNMCFHNDLNLRMPEHGAANGLNVRLVRSVLIGQNVLNRS